MKPIPFTEQNHVWQPSDLTHIELPAYTNRWETISRWRLTWAERWRVLRTGQLWLRQCNYGEPLQPQLIQTETPFVQHAGRHWAPQSEAQGAQ